MKRTRLLALSAATILFSSGLIGLTGVAAANPKCDAVDGDYIISFTKNANSQAEIKSAPGRAISPAFTYDAVLNGFAATLSAEQVCAFRKRPNIEFIELDQVVQTAANQALAPDNSLWGLDRIDQNSKTLDRGYTYASEGSGISVYVVDTGILSRHTDFGSRVRPGFSSIRKSTSTEDCNGHGTHVAGTIAGTTHGVAKQSLLVPVRVLACNGSGTNSSVISGLNWIAKNAVGNRSVVNMSLGGGASSTLDSAVNNLITRNVAVVVAAGNSAVDACTSSPARVPGAITVAASGVSDNFASYSNHGSCVDIIAPGSGIKSAWHTSTSATNTISGTSMAAPHVAGGVARYLAASSTAAQLLTDADSSGVITPLTATTTKRFLYLNPSR